MYRLGVIGNPIAHSRSPQIHRQFGAEYGVDLCYEAMLAEKETFANTVQRFFAEGGHGLNVTLPFKEQAFALAEKVSEAAAFAHAANTLWCDEEGKLCADNTDGMGLLEDLRSKNAPFDHADVLIIGAGGAARGIVLPLAQQKLRSLSLANRSLAKAQDIINALQQRCTLPCRALSLNALADRRYDIIIHATSAGLKDEFFPLSSSIYRQESVAYDLIYGFDTPFMQHARAAGCSKVFDGYGMLIAQARASFRIWFNI